MLPLLYLLFLCFQKALCAIPFSVVIPKDPGQVTRIQAVIDGFKLNEQELWTCKTELGTYFWAFEITKARLCALSHIQEDIAEVRPPEKTESEQEPVDEDETDVSGEVGPASAVEEPAEPSETISPSPVIRAMRQRRAPSPPSGVVTQSPVPIELQYLGTDQAGKPEKQPYYYQDRSCSGTVLFVIDSGFYRSDKYDDARIIGKINVFIPDSFGIWTFDQKGTHGMCAASKAVGKKYGVCKSGGIVIVDVVYSDAWDLQMIQALAKVEEYVVEKNLQGRAVINISRAVGSNYMYTRLIQGLLKKGIPIVLAAGNKGKTRRALDSHEAAWQYTRGIMIASMTDQNGYADPNTQWVDKEDERIFAVGIKIKCMGGRGYFSRNLGWTATASGTSFAGPQIAGLAMYLISLNRRTSNMANRIPVEEVAAWVHKEIEDAAYPRAWPRGDPVPKIIYNKVWTPL